LRKEIEPVTAIEFLQFLAAHQHVDPEHRLEGVRGVAEVVRQLAGFELPAAAWEASVLPARVKNYKREWLDQLTLSGEIAWGRLWANAGNGATAIRTTPLCLIPREDLDAWTSLARPFDAPGLEPPARAIFEALRDRGAMFPKELVRRTKLSAPDFDEGLGHLIARGIATCDHYGALRALVVSKTRRWLRDSASGRWSFFRHGVDSNSSADTSSPNVDVDVSPENCERIARQLLRRTGVVFRKTIAREKVPVPWRVLLQSFERWKRAARFAASFRGRLRRRTVRVARICDAPSRGSPSRSLRNSDSRIRCGSAQFPGDSYTRRTRLTDDAQAGAALVIALSFRETSDP
jgi:ATP-dependent Lhr-like helicase